MEANEEEEEEEMKNNAEDTEGGEDKMKEKELDLGGEEEIAVVNSSGDIAKKVVVVSCQLKVGLCSERFCFLRAELQSFPLFTF